MIFRTGDRTPLGRLDKKLCVLCVPEMAPMGRSGIGTTTAWATAKGREGHMGLSENGVYPQL